jgi:hypothetical protein
MKTTEITTIKLEADKGKVLTDGNTYGSVIFLGAGKSMNAFYEITEEEYKNIKKEFEAQNNKEEE